MSNRKCGQVIGSFRGFSIVVIGRLFPGFEVNPPASDREGAWVAEQAVRITRNLQFEPPVFGSEFKFVAEARAQLGPEESVAGSFCSRCLPCGIEFHPPGAAQKWYLKIYLFLVPFFERPKNGTQKSRKEKKLECRSKWLNLEQFSARHSQTAFLWEKTSHLSVDEAQRSEKRADNIVFP